MKKIFITEKPSVARQFANALSVSSQGKTDGYIEDDDIIITWAVGHLIQLLQPDEYDPKYKTWNLDDLPFLPKTYRYGVIPSMKKQYGIVKKIFTRDYPEGAVIYDCGDSGREGQYIQALIYRQTGSKIPVKRVWIDSQTDEEILRGIREAKPESEYDNLTDAGYMRAIEDFAFGINLSRALTKKFEGEMDRRTGKSTISVGRVMTCVLGMVVERQMQIDDFKPTTYYKVIADVDTGNSNIDAEWKAVEGSRYFENSGIYNETGFLDKKEADKFTNVLSQDRQLTVADITYKEEKKYAPLLFNLAELQNACSKRYKFTPKHTLEIAQSLYEKKLTTYPRTDARVLSSAIAKEISKNISGLSKGNYRQQEALKILEEGRHKNIGTTRYTDDKKITDHYAIIPTGYTKAELSQEEENVYHLIIDRFLSIFYPPAVYGVSKATFVHSLKESFFASSKVIKDRGYTVITGKESDEEIKESSPLVSLSKGQVLGSTFSLKEGKTSPPKPYNSGSMILAMENAGNLIEEEELREQLKGSGIGTSATRADIIDKLVKIGYITINKKTQILAPDKTGYVVYDIVKRTVPALLKPKMTANWEMGLSQVESGQIKRDQYQKVLDDFVTKQVEAIKKMQGEEKVERQPQIIGKCPVCGKNLIETKLGSYVCEGFKKDGTGCFFSVHSSIVTAGKDKLVPLITDGRPTEIIEGIKKKDGSTYNAALSIDLTQKKIVFTFGQAESDILGKCPKCGGDIVKGKFGAYCTNKCGLMNISSYFGKKLTDAQVKKILAGKTVLVKGLHSKAKNVDYDVNIKLTGITERTYTAKDGSEKTGYQLEYERSFANNKKALPKSIDAALKEAIQMAKDDK